MHRRKAFTLVELLVVIGIIVLLMAIIVPPLHRPKELLGRRAVCLNNLRQLSLAWVMYSDENDGKLVNGMLGQDRTKPGDPSVIKEEAWVGIVDAGWPFRERQINGSNMDEGIKNGALWEYIKNPKVYHCPAGKLNHLVTYQIVDSMNGFQQPDTVADGVWVNNRGDLSMAHNKLVFIDIGEVRSSSYHVSYRDAKWLDMPPVRHRDGATVSFADAHSEYWKWKGQDTIGFGRNEKRSDGDLQPTSPEGKEDLQKMQEAVWGKLGYNPNAID
ncbi:MAG: type II secretion system protein [Planctomycetota bacterium]|jgi:prepilin-type N-terminal cleavage/methylation domain-containing protein